MAALERDQTAPIVLALAAVLLIEPLLGALLAEEVTQYGPVSAAAALGESEGYYDGDLSPLAGGLTMAGWTVALGGLGQATLRRRDVPGASDA